MISPPVTRTQVVFAVGLSACLVAAFAAAMPFGRHATRGAEVILPAYAAATLMLEIMTSMLLSGRFSG